MTLISLTEFKQAYKIGELREVVVFGGEVHALQAWEDGERYVRATLP